MTGSTPYPRWPWLVCLVAAVAMIAALSMFSAIPGQTPCDGDQTLDAMIRFEWVRSAAELAQLFGQEPCRSTLADAMDAMNRVDVNLFIPAFTLFQIAAAWVLRRDGRLLGILVINAALIAGACDFIEDGHLVGLTAALRMEAPIDQAVIDQLFWLVRTKFALLAFNAILLGWLIGKRAGSGWRLAKWLMVAGGLIGLAGLAQPALLGLGIGLAWVTLLIVAAVRAVRPHPQSLAEPG